MNDQFAAKLRAGQLIFYVLMFAFGAIFLMLLPQQTRPGPGTQGWWTQPRLMPAISLGLVALTATILLGHNIYTFLRLNSEEKPNPRAFGLELFDWVRSFEFLFYFYLYVQLFKWVGYFFSSLIFIVWLCVRVGLRAPRWFLIAGLTAIALVAVFKWPWWGYGLQVFMPRPELFSEFPDLLPQSVENFWQKWF